MKTVLFSRRDAARRGGFTLVEVVIALAIFVFGAVAIIRIFPPALGIIQNSGDKLTALNLNRTSLARFAKNSSAVPDAIHDAYFAGQTPLATAVVGTAIRNNSLPRRNFQAVEGSALDRFRYISGEKQKVRSVSVLFNGTAIPVNYVLTSFPIYAPDPDPTRLPLQKPPLAKIYRETLVRGVLAETRPDPGPGPTLRRSGFLDFTNSSPVLSTATLPAGDENFYYISYQFLDGGVLNGTTDEVVRSQTPNGLSTILINQAQLLQSRRFPPSQAAPNALNTSRVIDGPVDVKFRQLIFDPNATRNNLSQDLEVQNTLNNLGMIVVNGVTNLNAGDEVSVDYRINNWQQIVHSGLPSISPETQPIASVGSPIIGAGAAKEMVLPLRALADNASGAVPSPRLYSLLSYIDVQPITGANFPTIQANALDANDTLISTAPNSIDPIANLSVRNPYFLRNVNRKGGRLVYDVTDRANTANSYQTLGSRVVYQTIDNWTNQLSVAPTSYTPFYDDTLGSNRNNVNNSPSFTGEPGNVNVAQKWRYYSWNVNAQPGRIYFPPSEAGKTISLSYTYTAIINGAPVQKEVNNAVVTISSKWAQRNEAPPPDTTGPRALAISDNDAVNPRSWLAYAEPLLNASGNPVALTAIRSIKGISIQSRTAWLDGANYAQVSTVGFRGESN